MGKSSKLQVYKGIIQYLLDSPGYTLKRIASHSNSSIKSIQSIYRYDEMPNKHFSEVHLTRLYLLILEIENY